MLYRQDKYGNPISQLGFGCMRFTRKNGGIDYGKASRELMLAYEAGVNYFDTAYIYPGSEEMLGRFLEENHLRDKVNIATKLPQYMTRSLAAADKFFNEELRRLRTDHIDYYLMHMFTDDAEWQKLDSMGIRGWIDEKRKSGQIRQIGFSYHGDTEMFLKILNAYDWDFCQIQYNYLDENTQAGRKGLEAARAKGVPVIIMEPLRGGKLVNIPSDARAAMKESGRSWSPAEWGLRWLWDQPGVTCILSGMNSEEMVRENLRTAAEAETGSFTESDLAVIEQVKRIIRAREQVGCTACRYCMPCPKGVDIPATFFAWNMMYAEGKKSTARFEYARNVGLRSEPAFATQCIGCGKCEQHCPQHLPIREKLKQADRDLRPLPYRVGISLARLYFARKKKK